jgi:hypothetical protein
MAEIENALRTSRDRIAISDQILTELEVVLSTSEDLIFRSRRMLKTPIDTHCCPKQLIALPA